MGLVKSYKDLVAWQRAMDLAEAVYASTRAMPREETYGLVAQMRGAAVSIAANVAEGHARNSTGEYRQFLGIAKGSLAELETEIALAERVGLLTTETTRELTIKCEMTSKVLSGLHKAIAGKSR